MSAPFAHAFRQVHEKHVRPLASETIRFRIVVCERRLSETREQGADIGIDTTNAGGFRVQRVSVAPDTASDLGDDGFATQDR